MRVLIVGAGGNIGSDVQAALATAGHEVLPVRRSAGAGQIQANFANADDFRNRLANVQFDAAICMLGMNTRDADLMLAVCGHRGAHLIWTSTVCVFGGPLPDGGADDATARNPVSDYGRNKMAAEDLLLRNADLMPVTIIRPASTGSAGFPILRQLSVTNSWLDRIDEGKPVVIGGDGTQQWSWSTARDVAAGYALVVGDERAFGKAYTVTRPDPISWNDWHEGVAAIKGKKIELAHLPAETILASDVPHGLFAEQSQWNQVYSPAAFQRDFPEWEVRDNFEGAIRKALANQVIKPDAAADAAEDRLIGQAAGLRVLLLPVKPQKLPKIRT